MSPLDPDELELDADTDGPTGADGYARTRRRTVASALRPALSPKADQRLDDVPHGLWDRIAHEAGSEAAGQTHDHDAGAAQPRLAPPDDAGAAPVVPAPRQLLDRRTRRTVWLVGTAAAVLLVLVGIVAVVIDAEDEGTTVAQAQLEPLPAAVPGTEAVPASVVERDGAQKLDVVLDIPTADGFYEVSC